jgi:hypothetical protein
MVGRGGTKEEIMKAKATRRLIAAVGLSALAAVLASSAQARIPEGNGTRPPLKTVVKHGQAGLSAVLAALASSAQAHVPEGNGTQPPSTVTYEGQTPPASGTFFVDPGSHTALTSSTVVEPRLARHRARTSSIDAETCAALDPAIRAAIQGCAHAVPLAAQQLRTGRAQQQLETFPAGYRGLP